MAAPAPELNRLLVVGELCVDLIIETGDEIRFGQHEQIVPATTLTMGSSSAITACGAAALGVPTALVSVRGDDTFGAFLDAELARRGVATDLIRVEPSLPTGASTHLTRPGGDRAILTSMGSIGTVTATDVPAEAIREAGHLHLGSYFLQHALQPDASRVFADARAQGLTTSLDGNFDPAETWDGGILDVLAHTDVFFGNEQELTGITRTAALGQAIALATARMPDGGIVVAKLGADGALAVQRAGGTTVTFRARTPEVTGELVDTVGAGDTLAAGFIAARLRGASVPDALAFAVACGTASTRGAGGVSAQPDRTTATQLAATVEVAEIATPEVAEIGD
ncbi:carbohydrate kinase family protein [Agromyces silvae]|uniref:carbohydrate kinase family protein n=1 Tax=Agromyces silvae TaxID=3388266 RepID=UPI00280B822E|nr:sugar kinase [Agromyces protaetiae]